MLNGISPGLKVIRSGLAPARHALGSGPWVIDSCVAAAWILLTVVLVRLAWITFYRTTLRTLVAHGIYHPKDPKQVASAKGGLIISWCGMRGLVTLERTVVNQRGEVVQEGETDLIVERRRGSP